MAPQADPAMVTILNYFMPAIVISGLHISMKICTLHATGISRTDDIRLIGDIVGHVPSTPQKVQIRRELDSGSVASYSGSSMPTGLHSQTVCSQWAKIFAQ
jgi:hypothetical protein